MKNVVNKMLLFGMLMGIALATVVSMIMTMLHLQSGEKSSLGKYWIILSSVGIVSIVGTLFVMREQGTTHAVATVEQQNEQQNHADQNGSQMGQGVSVQAPHPGNESTDSDTMITGSNEQMIQSYDYLVEVLEALKNGKPIPDKYLQLLPESDQAKLRQASDTTIDSTRRTEGTVPAVKTGGSARTYQTALYAATSSSIQSTSVSGHGSNDNQQHINSAPKGDTTKSTDNVATGSTVPQSTPPTEKPASSSSPTVPAIQPSKAKLADSSPVLNVLHNSRDQVRAYFQSLYAQPLQQTTDRDLYLTGDAVMEVKYKDNQASALTILYENLSPAGKDRGYWEQSFRNVAGMGDQPPTSSDTTSVTWNGVYEGTNQIQFAFELINNRGMIQAN